MEIIRQNYIDKLIRLRDTDLIKVITGVRRAGKSTLLEQFQQQLRNSAVGEAQILSINFEKREFSKLKQEEQLYDYIVAHMPNSEKCYIFLDEIQLVESFELVISSLQTIQNTDIYITGSNAHLLSSELATLLTGRHIDIEVLPLSFFELASAYPQEDHDKLFSDYVKHGGFPGLLNFNFELDSNIAFDYLNTVLNDIIQKDIMVRKKIKSSDKITKVAEFLFSAAGSNISSSNIKNVFSNDTNSTVSHNTILSYINYLSESFLFYRCKRYNIGGKELLRTNSKFYAVDTGLRNASATNRSLGQDLGHQLENIVYLELIRRGYEVNVGKTYNAEIDFIAKRGDSTQYIQVAYLLANDAVVHREFGAFASIRDSYPKIVLSLDKFNMSQDGIEHKNLIDWLLSPELM